MVFTLPLYEHGHFFYLQHTVFSDIVLQQQHLVMALLSVLLSIVTGFKKVFVTKVSGYIYIVASHVELQYSI